MPPDGPPERPLSERSLPPPRRPAPPASNRPAPPKHDYAAEEAAARQQADIGLLVRRGSFAEAEAAAQAILAARPGDAFAHETLGDVLAGRGDADGAKAAYKAALAHEPGRASAESKFATLTLEGAESRRRSALGVGYAAEDTHLVRSGAGRGLWAGIVGSAICPGLGQIVQGQVVKGVILVAIYVAGLGMLALLPKGNPGQSYFGPGFWLISALMTADWVYAVADIAFASKSAD